MSSAPKIRLPEEIEGLQLVASVSGGKDSTALILALREAELPFSAVFADTGWESEETYRYLDLLRRRLDLQIDTVGAEGGMRARAKTRAGFPARMQRWCTRELKIEPLRAYHDLVEEAEGVETVCVVGVRGGESVARAQLPELEDEPEGRRSWGGWVWRPLHSWSIADVLAIHARHGVPVNPLYQKGHDRVGCYPCIFSNKEEIRLLADEAPERIAEIRELEAELTQLRSERNAKKPGRYAHPQASFFQGRRGSPLGVAPKIDDVVGWARTDRGGRQLPLLAPEPRGGCMRWGLCDVAPAEREA